MVSALAKMDPRFIFNHAGPGPICLVYSAEERTGLGGDHYLDTQLTNEAGAAPPPLLLAVAAAVAAGSRPGFSFFVPHSCHPATAPSDCHIAQCVGHGNKHTHTTLHPLRDRLGATDCAPHLPPWGWLWGTAGRGGGGGLGTGLAI